MENLSVYEAVRELYIALTALLFNLVFFVFLEGQGYRHMRSKRAFRNFTLMVAVAHLASCLDVFFWISEIRLPPVANVCSTVIVTMTNQMMSLYFSIYFVRFFARLEQKEYDIPKYNYVVTGVKALVFALWMAWSIPYVLHTGEESVLPTAIELGAGYGLNLYHICWCLVFFVRKRKILRRRTRYAAIAGFFVVISTIVLQTVVGSVPHFYYLGPTIALMIFYFTMESRPAIEITTEGRAAMPVVMPVATVAPVAEAVEAPTPTPAAPTVPSTSAGKDEATPAPPVEAPTPAVPVADAAPTPVEAPVEATAAPVQTPLSPDDILPEPDESVTREEALRRVRAAAPQLLASYRALTEVLSPYFGTLSEEEGTEEDLPEISREELDELYEAVREFSDAYDQDAILRLLEQTKGYALPEADRERLKKVKELAAASDWSGLSALD
ncbi:MAG: hypothetical protein IK016_00835 [Lachnospiraceae bacterium]|nr:hypothetical protein [Lachnospiraceae bacterium]